VATSLAAIRVDGSGANTVDILAGATAEHRTAGGDLDPTGVAISGPASTVIGTLLTTGSIDLGSGGRLNNSDLLDIGGTSSAAPRVNGDFTQTATGQLLIYVDTRHRHGDQLLVSGNAVLGGKILIRPSSQARR
jgi:hypothetical protein